VLRRIAGNCFWLGRYLERAENTARLAAAANARHDLGETPRAWVDALAIGAAAAGYAAVHETVAAAPAAAFLLVERANPGSVAQSLRAAGANARSARDLLGDAYWEAINTAWIEADALDPIDVAGKGPEELAEWAQTRCRTIRGAGDDLPRDEVAHAIAVGGAVERCDFVARLLAVTLGGDGDLTAAPPTLGTPERERLEFLLAAIGLRDAFRRLHGGDGGPEQAWALLVSSPSNPRSLLLNLVRLEAGLAALAGSTRSPALAEVAAIRERVSRWAQEPPTDDRVARLGETHLAIGAAAAAIERDHFTAAETPAPATSPAAPTPPTSPTTPSQSQSQER